MKRVFLLVLIVGMILVTGCSNSKYSEPILLTYDEYNKKIENNESFAMLIWRTGCSHCEDFEPKLNEIIKDYDLEIYSVNVATFTENEYAKLENKTFVTGTPTLVVFEKGKYKTKLIGDKDKEQVISFLKQNKYIR